jgi:uncharacterized protein YqjF (DUF2071 family)
VLFQRWEDLLFMHWPVPVEVLRSRVPPTLRIDTFDGRAWLGIVPFRMRDVHLRRLPRVRGLSAFPELNVRTYVTVGGTPGVFFLSLDAGNPVAVAAARIWAHLAYFNAEMEVRRERGTIRYTSHRTHGGSSPADFAATYRPVGEATVPERGTLADWLTSRYCLYAADRHGGIVRIEVDHPRWALQAAEATISINTMAAAHAITLPDHSPLLHFARRMDVRTWWPHRLPPRRAEGELDTLEVGGK